MTAYAVTMLKPSGYTIRPFPAIDNDTRKNAVIRRLWLRYVLAYNVDRATRDRMFKAYSRANGITRGRYADEAAEWVRVVEKSYDPRADERTFNRAGAGRRWWLFVYYLGSRLGASYSTYRPALDRASGYYRVMLQRPLGETQKALRRDAWLNHAVMSRLDKVCDRLHPLTRSSTFDDLLATARVAAPDWEPKKCR